MYIAQYGPKDIIYDARQGFNNIHYISIHGIEAIRFESTVNCYLTLTLPEVWSSKLEFVFFLLTEGQFELSVDPYTNNSENYSTDYLTNFINPINSTIAGSISNTVNKLSLSYNGLSHKFAQDRCIFRLKALTVCTLAGIIVRVP